MELVMFRPIFERWWDPVIDIGHDEFNLIVYEDYQTGSIVLKNIATDETRRITLMEMEDTHTKDIRDLIRSRCLEIATKHTPRTKWNRTNHGSFIS